MSGPLMPPSEVEQLAFDLLADLAPIDESPESGAAVATVHQIIVIDFCHDWRSLWYLQGEHLTESRSQFESLVMLLARSSVRCRPYGLLARVISRAFVLQSPVAGNVVRRCQRCAPEKPRSFNVASKTSESAVEIDSGSGSPSSATRPSSEPEVKTKAAVATTPGKPPVIERPLIILSAPQGGSRFCSKRWRRRRASTRSVARAIS